MADVNKLYKQALKLAKGVTEEATSTTRRYSKTNDKLLKVKECCEQIAQTLDVILQSAQLEDTGVDEFNSASHEFCQNNANELQQRIDAMKALADTTEEVKDISENVDTSRTLPVLSHKQKSLVNQNYKTVLSDLDVIPEEYQAIRRCGSMISDWFYGRIIKKHPGVPNITYDVRKYKNIIHSFVILYGHYMETGYQEDFENRLVEWLKTVDSNPVKNRWIAPYEIFKLHTNLDNLNAKYANVTSVVIWDILVDTILKPLLELDDNGCYITEGDMWKIMSNCNIGVLDTYKNHNDDINILYDLGLSAKGDA